MKKFNIIKYLKLENILKIFKKKSKRNTILTEERNYKLYKRTERTNLNKKRKSFKLKFDFKKRLTFIKKTYIPYFLIFFIIFVVIIIGVLLSPIFKVKYIIIKKDNLIDMNIAYKAVEDIRGKSIFNIEKKDLLKRFKNYQENVEDIDLKVNFPETLDIQIKSYKEVFSVYIGGKNYLLLENGSLVPKINNEIQKINVVNNFGKNKFLDYKKVYNEKYIKKIIDIIAKLKENITGVKINYINFYNLERELHIKINDSTILIFSIDNDISTEEQIRNLAIFNKEYKTLNKNDVMYIDLRIKDKAFFCEKNNEYRCNVNLKSIYPEVELEPKKTEAGSGTVDKKIEN